MRPAPQGADADLIIVMITGLDDPRTINLARDVAQTDFWPNRLLPDSFWHSVICAPRPKVETAKAQPSGKVLATRSSWPALTARENRLMEYMAEGLPYKEIAEKTRVSKSAVHGMRNNIFKKLGGNDKVEAIRKWKTTTASP